MPAAVQLEACRTSTLYQMIQEAKETMEEDEEEEDAELPAPPTKKQRTRKGQQPKQNHGSNAQRKVQLLPICPLLCPAMLLSMHALQRCQLQHPLGKSL